MTMKFELFHRDPRHDRGLPHHIPTEDTLGFKGIDEFDY